MQNQIELRMSELPDLGYEENPIEHIDVAVTTLAYDNAKLINLLRKRGQFIISESYESMREVDEKINKLKQAEF